MEVAGALMTDIILHFNLFIFNLLFECSYLVCQVTRRATFLSYNKLNAWYKA
jgi:hypothetical protein